MKNETAKSVNLGRHERCCKICSHKKREDIEQDSVAWKSPIAIAKEYGLSDRMNVYRHANALGLFGKRRRNIRAALERIIDAHNFTNNYWSFAYSAFAAMKIGMPGSESFHSVRKSR
jgi:hypothetical protein